MMRCSIPKQDIWLSSYPNCKKKHLHSPSRRHRKVPFVSVLLTPPSKCFVPKFVFCDWFIRSARRGQLSGSCAKGRTYRDKGSWGQFGGWNQGPTKEKRQERELCKGTKDWITSREPQRFGERAEQPGQHVFLQRSHSSKTTLHQLNYFICICTMADVIFPFQNLSQTHLLRQTLNKETEKRSVNIQPDAASSLVRFQTWGEGWGDLLNALLLSHFLWWR